MSTITDNYLREVEASLRVDAARKRQIVDELRTHLADKIDETQRAQPDRAPGDIEREVVRDFGNPRDLALAYEPDGTAVLKSQAGDIVLRLGKAAAAVGRGTGRVLKWTAVALGILLVVALGVGAWAYYEVKPYIPSIIESSDPAYEYYERCVATPCSGSAPADTFYVRPEVRTVRFDLNLYSVHQQNADWDRHVGNGTVTVVVTDPAGMERFHRTVNMTDEAGLYLDHSWAAVAGNWTVAYTFDAFVGAIKVEAYAISMPFGDDR